MAEGELAEEEPAEEDEPVAVVALDVLLAAGADGDDEVFIANGVPKPGTGGAVEGTPKPGTRLGAGGLVAPDAPPGVPADDAGGCPPEPPPDGPP